MKQQAKSNQALLKVKNFSLSFRTYQKGLKETTITVINNLNVTVHAGEIVAIVGASGSGKSLLASAVLGILPEHASWQGDLNYKGNRMTDALLREVRGTEIAYIPQSVEALNPLMKVGKQVEEAVNGKEKKSVQQEIFTRVGLPEDKANRYPFELSGGMARRVLLSTAMVSAASLIIADEPTPGLDPTVLSQSTKALKQLANSGKGIMFISHDITTALSIADKVVVFNQGETIEEASVEAFSGKGEQLKHPFTRKLWNCLPENQFFEKENKPPELDNSLNGQQSFEARGLSFKYKASPYLFKDVSLTIRPGEIVGMQGYSGSGKSTLAKVLAGYEKALHGDVNIAGKPSSIYPVQLVWQHPEKAINPMWKMKKVLAESNMDKSLLLDELGIQQEWLDRWPSELSGGELQRFCLARALCNDTKYLIADEMTTMLDSVTQAKLWEIVCRISRERQIGVLAISHDHKLLQRISDRIIDFQDMIN
ncbi:ABC transporter ATP-binding protein [Radiobacillus sp. PE A8.2]|uniref:ABC transporter ATP-binding protein n=1 Tax=Radiobacillus sp. PE A8.2 TaxID=3380349 RepID=UPI00388EDB52